MIKVNNIRYESINITLIHLKSVCQYVVVWLQTPPGWSNFIAVLLCSDILNQWHPQFLETR